MWTLGVDLPLVGQELLFFDYQENIAKGPFAFRLRKQGSKKHLDEVYGLLAQLFVMVDDKALKHGWRLDFKDDNKVTLDYQDDFSAEFFAKKGDKYYRTILNFSKDGLGDFRLQLFSDSCSINEI